MTTPGQGRGAPPLEQPAQDTLAAVRGQQRYQAAAVVLPPEPPPMTEEERRLAEQAAKDDARTCKYCIGVHRYPTSIGCPRIASAELDGEGQVRKVSFWPGTKWSRGRVIFMEDLLENDDESRTGKISTR